MIAKTMHHKCPEPRYQARLMARVMRIEGLLRAAGLTRPEKVMQAITLAVEDAYCEGKGMLREACTSLSAMEGEDRFGSLAQGFASQVLATMHEHADQDTLTACEDPADVCGRCYAPHTLGNWRWTQEDPPRHRCVGVERPVGRLVRLDPPTSEIEEERQS